MKFDLMQFLKSKTGKAVVVGGVCVVLAAAIVFLAFQNITGKELPVDGGQESLTAESADSALTEETSSVSPSDTTGSATSAATTASSAAAGDKTDITESGQSTAQSSSESGSYLSETNEQRYARLDTARAKELAEFYYRDFYDSNAHLLRISLTGGTATAWEYGALMSTSAVMGKLDSQRIPLMDNVFQGIDYYGYANPDGSLWGVVVNRSSTVLGAPTKDDGASAYDDSEWIVIDYLRAYELTGNQQYLDRAEGLSRTIISDGWFEPLGGIFWNTKHEARHSCSNNPMIKPLVDLYKITGDSYYLDWAKKIYDFSVKNLKDTSKNIYNDLVGAQLVNGVWVEGSSANTGYYTYNTGTMISGAAALYGVTGEQKYLDEALGDAEGAMAYFGDRKLMHGYVSFPSTSTIWFNDILLRGYIDLYPYAKEEASGYIQEFQKSIDYAYGHYFHGSYLPCNWLMGWDYSDRDRDTLQSLDESSNIEMYAMLANHYSNL